MKTRIAAVAASLLLTLLGACAGQPQASSHAPKPPLAGRSGAVALAPIPAQRAWWVWSQALLAASNNDVSRIESWWNQGNPEEGGCVPFRVLALPGANEAGLPASASFTQDQVTFTADNYPLRLRTSPPRPTSITRGGKQVPVVYDPSIDLMLGKPQRVYTLMGIASAYALFPELGAVAPHSLRNIMRLEVPSATRVVSQFEFSACDPSS